LFTPARELNGTLPEVELPIENFEGVHRSIFLGPSASVKGSSGTDRVTLVLEIRVTTSQTPGLR
jgi:hypothetical protein